MINASFLVLYPIIGVLDILFAIFTNISQWCFNKIAFINIVAKGHNIWEVTDLC